MKKVLAIVVVVMLLMAMAPVALAADVTVNVTVSIDGKLLVVAQPVTTSDPTLQGVLIAAHKAFYSEGEAGYKGGIDATYNMFLISKCWGISGVPYIMQNDAPIQVAVDVGPVLGGDNIIICESSDTAVPATPVSMSFTDTDGKITVKATSWTLDMATFTYAAAPVANANVVDSAGASLGTTDAEGLLALAAAPADGIVAIDGLAAINVGAVKEAPPPVDYSVFGGPDGRSLLILVIIGLGFAIPLGCIVLYGQRKELKNRGLKYK